MDTMAGPGLALDATATALRFELLEMLGKGGMGCVWKAREIETGAIVALKSLHAWNAAQPIMVQRFEREAELAARIRHANVAVVHGLVENAGESFLSMEYVEGKTLGRIIEAKKKIPMGATMRLFAQICAGVQAAHDEGVIHRDLKPDNVLVARRDGRAVIVDFGIAMSFADDRMTQTGMVVGSLHYMSPEQLYGKDVTERSDIYSLGVLLFELVTGVCPFNLPHLTLPQCLTLRNTVPNPRDHVPDLPDYVVEAIRTCLAIDPLDRFGTPREIWRFLAAHLGSADHEETGIVLHVDGAEVVINAAPQVVVAVPVGPLRAQIVDRLKRIGCRIVEFDDGHDALKWSFESRTHLIILSDTVGGIDPRTACQVMKRFARWDLTRTLVLVDSRVEAADSDARSAGATDVATVPLNIHSFTQKIRQLLG